MLALPQRLFCPFYGLQWKGVLRDMLNHHSYHHHWRSLDIINTIWSVESSREPNGACIKMIHRQGALVALKETLFRHKIQVQCNTGSYGYISFRQILQNLGFEGSSPQYWIRWWLCYVLGKYPPLPPKTNHKNCTQLVICIKAIHRLGALKALI